MIGNWFVEHYGNKYEYHEGDTYIKQKGSTYIEQEGTVRIKHEGDKSVEHIGHYYLTHNGDTMETHTGTYFMMVDGDVTFTFNSEYKLTVGKNYTETVELNKNADIFGSKNLNIYDSYNEIVANNKFISSEGFYDLLVGESITTKSSRGNILLETEGNFELTKEGKITPVGFTNIGTKGNIQLISTFGNINLQCKKDDSKAQFNKKCITIPWNPSFVTQLEKLALLYPSFNKIDSILGAEELNDKLDLSSFDISKFVKSFKEFTSSLLIYDGLPVFLPTRMIVQNPNISIPKNVDDVSWVPNFRSEAKEWREISSSDFWKLPGRMMGNINIETWSGDINIKTNSELGCAGNINIEATESAGTLPGYKIGTVNIKNEGKKRIYPDPRDLFLDSDFQSRLGGQFKLFKHATNFRDPFRKSVLPSAADAILKEFTGCSFDWVGTNYDDFYKLYATQILTKGKMGSLTANALKSLAKLTEKPGPKLGCPKCISDYLYGLPGIQDICYASEIFEHFASEAFISGHKGFHECGFFKYNPFDKENPRGTFNILTMDFDKISIGDGHAIDIGFIDKEYVGPNIGAFNLSSSGDFNHTIGRNYQFKCNTNTENGEKIVNYTYTEKWYDDVWPTSFSNTFTTLTNLFNQGISSVGRLNITGDFTVSKISTVGLVKTSFKFLSTSLPHDKFTVIGYTVKEFNKTGNKLTKTYEEGFESSIDLGFDITNVLKVLQNPEEIMKRTMTFTDYVFTKNIIDNTTNIDKKVEEINRKFVLGLKDPYPLTINVKKSYFYDDIKVENSALNSINYGDDNLHILSGVNEFNLKTSKSYEVPDINIKINDHCKRIVGHGYDKDTDYISYLEYKDNQAPISTYIDYMENELKSVVSDLPEHAGEPRNISITEDYLAKRSIEENVSWKAAINTNTLTLNSVGYFHDEAGKSDISVNNVTVKMIGNTDSSGEIDYSAIKENEFIYDANNFKNNKIFINNGPSGVIDSSLNKIEINNGNATKGTEADNVKNEIFINNGKDVQFGTNNIKFENGTSGQISSVNHNRYVINNGQGGGIGTISQYDVFNGDANASEQLSTIIKENDEIYARITEYSAVERISNIGVTETKNVGSFQTINVGDTQKINVGVNQNSIIGTTRTVDVGDTLSSTIGNQEIVNIKNLQKITVCKDGVGEIIINAPTYTFNTINMTMNNKTSTSINTETYTLTTIDCNITSSNSGSWLAPSITLNEVDTLGTHNGKGYLKGDFTGNFVGAAGPNSNHVFVSVDGSVSANVPPLDTPAPTAPSVQDPPSSLDPAPFPGVKTPKTPYLFTKLLQLYVEYLLQEFSYLLDIFK